MKISVIIPTLNEERHIEATLRSAADEHFAEVIVVDGGSDDRTVARARGAGAMIVNSPPGRALQMNAGARVSSGDVLLFLHADTQLPQGAGRDIVRALDDPRIVAGSFRLRFDDPSPVLRAYAFASRMNFGVSTFGDQGIFVRRRVFAEIGGYPAQPLMEDFEMLRRVKRVGRFVKLQASVLTSARRFVAVGTIRQQIINSMIVLAYLCGISPAILKRYYPNAK